jgi:hypothetical protein
MGMAVMSWAGEMTVTAERDSAKLPCQKGTLTFAELRQAGGLLMTTNRPHNGESARLTFRVDAHTEKEAVAWWSSSPPVPYESCQRAVSEREYFLHRSTSAQPLFSVTHLPYSEYHSNAERSTADRGCSYTRADSLCVGPIVV